MLPSPGQVLDLCYGHVGMPGCDPVAQPLRRVSGVQCRNDDAHTGTVRVRGEGSDVFQKQKPPDLLVGRVWRMKARGCQGGPSGLAQTQSGPLKAHLKDLREKKVVWGGGGDTGIVSVVQTRQDLRFGPESWVPVRYPSRDVRG